MGGISLPHHSIQLQVGSTGQEKDNAMGVFQQEGALVEEDLFDLERGGGFGGQNLLGFGFWA